MVEKTKHPPEQRSAYNVALADYLNALKSVAEYTGGIGETITVTAINDFGMKSVAVGIRQNNDTLVEKATAQQPSTGLGEYITQSTNPSPSGSKIITSATGKPENVSVQEAIVRCF